MNSVAVLQARTNSTRLPAKAMLPISGIPMAELAGLRAANTGRKIIVATSAERTDDALADETARYGLRCHRGSLENTLQRVIDALRGYEDDTLVIRLTADNVFPDGRLLDEMEQEFMDRGLNYLSSSAFQSGLPYGMSAELMRLGHLRDAFLSTGDEFDLEHVTPFLIRRFGNRVFEKYAHLNKGQCRCTVDSLDDYLRIQRVFLNAGDPIDVPALTLVDRLAALDDAPTAVRPVPHMILGGAQLGLRYGIANAIGQPGSWESETLIKTAVANGVDTIDTARAYGTSEKIIGDVAARGWDDRFRVVTKLAPLERCPSSADTGVVAAFVDASVFQSCAALRRQSLDVLLLHRAAHLEAWGGRVWSHLLLLKEQGVIKDLGVSIQTPQELAGAISRPEVRYIQMPFNILDTRWRTLIPQIEKIRSDRGLIVHARSALLQGLLPSSNAALWKRANVTQHQAIVEWLRSMTEACGREDILDLCFAYVRSQPWVDGVVVGTEHIDQLHANIRYFSSPNLSAQELLLVRQRVPQLPEMSLDPARWQPSID